jgi:hypothetical protein
MGASAGEVLVDDPTGCVSRGDLIIQLDVVLGAAAWADLVMDVRIVELEREREVEVQVRTLGGDPLWDRVRAFGAGDCPFVPAIIVRAVERGLDALEGWEWRVDPRARVHHPGAVGLAGGASFGSGPPTPRGHGDVWIGPGLGPRARLFFPLSVEVGGLGDVGGGGGQIVTADLGLGLGVHVTPSRGWFEPRLEVGGGPAWLVGSGFDRNLRGVVPRMAARLGFALGGEGPAELRLAMEATLVRVGAYEVGARDEVVAEPPARLLLGVGWRTLLQGD